MVYTFYGLHLFNLLIIKYLIFITPIKWVYSDNHKIKYPML